LIGNNNVNTYVKEKELFPSNYYSSSLKKNKIAPERSKVKAIDSVQFRTGGSELPTLS
jgi:hypothetical protein